MSPFILSPYPMKYTILSVYPIYRMATIFCPLVPTFDKSNLSPLFALYSGHLENFVPEVSFCPL